MLFEDLTIADLQRLVTALKGVGGEDVIKRIIANTAASVMPHGRVTMGIVQKLLDQTNGSIVLPDEAVACLQLPETLPPKVKTSAAPKPSFVTLVRQVRTVIEDNLKPKQNTAAGSKQIKSLTELVAACKFVNVDQNITSKNFPLSAALNASIELAPVKGCSFKNDVSAKEVIVALHSNERLVGIYHALKCVAENPQLVPARGQLVILGARWRKNDQEEYVPIIYHVENWQHNVDTTHGDLCLGLTSTAIKFGESCEFLVGVDRNFRGGICL